MYRIGIELTVFLAIAFGLSFVRPLYQIANESYFDQVINSEVFRSASKSQERFPAKTIVLGDSITNQLFSNRVRGLEIESLAANGYVTMVGYDLLAEQAVANNPETEHVVLILHPSCFQIELDNKYTYQCFVKPLYRPPFIELLSDEAERQLQQIPFLHLAQLPQIRVGNWSPVFVDKKFDPDGILLPELTRIHLQRMSERMALEGIRFQVLAPPMKDEWRAVVDDLRQEVLASSPSITRAMEFYFESVEYVSDDEFCDRMHLYFPEKHVQRYVQWIERPIDATLWKTISQQCGCE